MIEAVEAVDEDERVEIDVVGYLIKQYFQSIIEILFNFVNVSLLDVGLWVVECDFDCVFEVVVGLSEGRWELCHFDIVEIEARLDVRPELDALQNIPKKAIAFLL